MAVLSILTACSDQSSPSSVVPTNPILFQEYDGSRVRLYAIKPDGTDLQTLTNKGEGSGARWSTDGRHIVYVFGTSYTSEIRVMDADGSHRRSVTTISGYNADPDWAPDGGFIVFVTNPANQLKANIAIIGVDGAGFRIVGSPGLTGATPRWSPDGAQIAFSEFLPGGQPALFVVNTDGTELRQVTEGHYDIQPVWSPDSHWLVFTSINRSPDQVAHLYRVARTGGEVTALTSDPVYADYTAAWAAASNHLIVECRAESIWPSARLCILNTDGSGRRVLETSLTGQHNLPTWFDPLP